MAQLKPKFSDSVQIVKGVDKLDSLLSANGNFSTGVLRRAYPPISGLRAGFLTRMGNVKITILFFRIATFTHGINISF